MPCFDILICSLFRSIIAESWAFSRLRETTIQNHLDMNLSTIRYLLFILIFATGLSCRKYADPTNPDIIFTQVAGLPNGGRASAVAFTIGDKGYVALGKSKTVSGYLKDCWEYNPTENKWRKRRDFPGEARVKAMAATVNGKAYVGLGFGEVPIYQETGYLNDFWEYDPVLDKWTKKAAFPGTSTNATVSFVYKNEIYVGFGFTGTQFTKEMWKYSPSSNSWERLIDFSGDARVGGVITTNDSRVFFGTGFNTRNFNDWWEYFPTTNSWKQLKSMPDNGRVNAVALCVNDRFFVSTGRHFGGELTTGKLRTDVSEYDPNLNVWYHRGNIPGVGRESAISFTINGKGYIGFGETTTEILNDFWSFHP